nr:hypothetical protein [Tanacetum cinerariifolium]
MIPFCYHYGLLIHHLPKIQIVLMMMDPNLQMMMERRLKKIQVKKVNVKIKRKTNNVNTVSSTVNAAGTNEDNELPFDRNMSTLEDVNTFDFLRNDEDDGTVADMNNVDITIQVSHILTTRIHKDYHLDQVIRDLQSATQTRKMSKILEEHGKAFRVFNSRTRIVEENLHIRFSKSISNVVQKQVIMQAKLKRRHNLSMIPFCYHYGLLIHHLPKIQIVLMMMDPNLQMMMERRLMKIQVKKVNVKIKRKTNNVNTVSSTVNAAGTNEDNELLFDRNMSTLEDVSTFDFLRNDEDDGKAKKSVRLMMEKLFGMELELILLFWSIAKAKTINGEVQLHAKVDGKKIIITISSVRRDLRLGDEEGIDCLSNYTIFEQLALMGNPKRKDTQVPQPSGSTNNVKDEAVHKELGDRLVRAVATASSLETKTTQHNEIDSLKKRVKKLEKRNRSRNHKLKRLYKVGLSARVESSGDKESLGKDASKQERMETIDADQDITLVNVQNDAEMFDVNDLGGEGVFDAEQNEKAVEELVDTAQVSTAATTVTITTEKITLAQALNALKTSKPKVKGIVIHKQEEPDKSTTTTIISSQQSKDNGKGIMIEEPVKPKKKDQIRLNEEDALKL